MATLRGKKLSRYDLSYYDYHWFWGLRHNARVLPENMLTLHEQLMGNKKEWFYLKEQKINRAPVKNPPKVYTNNQF